MRKVVFFVLLLAVLFSGGVYFISKKGPVLLRRSIERSISKTVRIDAIEYHFPWTFELRNFRILETHAPFTDEVCFSADKVLLDVSPLSLSKKELILANAEVREAQVIVRHRLGRNYHALSDTMRRSTPENLPSANGSAVPSETPSDKPMPLVIKRFGLTDSRFQFIDYDIQDSGFVIQMDHIQANIKDIRFPFSEDKTLYRVTATMVQGRDRTPADFKLNGWTRFGDKETDALFSINRLELPYFAPYYSKLTSARLSQGELNSRASLTVHQGIFTGNVDLDLGSLYFENYEEEGQLFGLNADEVLEFFKDKKGRLNFQIVLRWNLGDATLRKREVIRQAVEQSLKKTLIANVGNFLEKTIQKISDEGIDASKEDLGDAVKKVKNLFR